MLWTRMAILTALCIPGMETQDDKLILEFFGIIFLLIGTYREIKGE